MGEGVVLRSLYTTPRWRFPFLRNGQPPPSFLLAHAVTSSIPAPSPPPPIPCCPRSTRTISFVYPSTPSSHRGKQKASLPSPGNPKDTSMDHQATQQQQHAASQPPPMAANPEEAYTHFRQAVTSVFKQVRRGFGLGGVGDWVGWDDGVDGVDDDVPPLSITAHSTLTTHPHSTHSTPHLAVDGPPPGREQQLGRRRFLPQGKPSPNPPTHPPHPSLTPPTPQPIGHLAPGRNLEAIHSSQHRGAFSGRAPAPQGARSIRPRGEDRHLFGGAVRDVGGGRERGGGVRAGMSCLLPPTHPG